MGPPTYWIFAIFALTVSSAKHAVRSCRPNPCGEKAICKMKNGEAICECPEGSYGNPWNRCLAECEKDSDCSSTWFCEKFSCKPVCSASACGSGAICSVVNHRPVCECPPGFKGTPNTRCVPECSTNSECPNNLVCYYPKCVNPCSFACGKNAVCEVKNHKTTCYCPKGMTGKALQSCRPETPEDVCSSITCVKNARCIAEKGEKGYLVPSCSCLRGYFPSEFGECRRGDCNGNADCAENRYCKRNQCIDPCTENMCPPSATCEAQNHGVICSFG